MDRGKRLADLDGRSTTVLRAGGADDGTSSVRLRRRDVAGAAAALESCRLMLWSIRSHGDELPFQRELVGRYFHDHAHIALPVVAVSPRRLLNALGSRRISGRRLLPKLITSPAWQAQHELLIA